MEESVEVKIARLEEKFGGMAEDISDIKKLLKGNGQPGLVKRVNDLDKKFAELDGSKKTLGAILGSSFFTGIILTLANKIFN